MIDLVVGAALAAVVAGLALVGIGIVMLPTPADLIAGGAVLVALGVLALEMEA